MNVAQKLIADHLVAGEMQPGTEIGISIDQTLAQDATGTMVMLELEAMGLDRARTELSAQYVDHNVLQTRESGGHFVVGGDNYGQGSSREHAAITPRYLGLRAVIAKRFARIHWQNLVNFGILPVTFAEPADYERVQQGDVLELPDLHERLGDGHALEVPNQTRSETYAVRHQAVVPSGRDRPCRQPDHAGGCGCSLARYWGATTNLTPPC